MLYNEKSTELRYIESVFFFLHNTFLGHSSWLHYVKYRAKESSSMIQLNVVQAMYKANGFCDL